MAKRIAAVVILAASAVMVLQYRKGRDVRPPGPEGTKAAQHSKEGIEKEGIEPGGPPEFDVQVELGRAGPRQVLYLTITERHGWYADHVYVSFWYREQDEQGQWRRVGDEVWFLCRRYLDFGATLVEETTLLDFDFPDLDDYGTTENWQARVRGWGRVLSPKPD